jgi:bifunctional non-homologous end joining protein LigD
MVAPAAPLPRPMLARSGQIPARGDWAYEVKWDGFRGLLSTEGRFRLRSRRGWDMTELVSELSAFPVCGTFDGELVAFNADGAPDFPMVCERLLNRKHSIRLSYVIFDVLSLEGRSLLSLPYSDRHAELEALDLNGLYWHTPENFDDGAALFEAVCERELEGVVAKRRSGRYRPGERGWIKTKNRDYWRYELERESAINMKRVRQFV